MRNPKPEQESEDPIELSQAKPLASDLAHRLVSIDEMNEALAHEEFRFREIHPLIRMGTASDRYGGWIGQIYSRERFGNRISKRVNRVGGRTFKEEHMRWLFPLIER